jgi:hypothetical protein
MIKKFSNFSAIIALQLTACLSANGVVPGLQLSAARAGAACTVAFAAVRPRPGHTDW